MNNYYVYALKNPENCHIFYIGKGKGYRAKDHLHTRCILSREKTRSYYHSQTILAEYIDHLAESGIIPEIIYIKTGLSEKDALQLERHEIDTMGTFSDGGTLLNSDKVISGLHSVVSDYYGLEIYNNGSVNRVEDDKDRIIRDWIINGYSV